MIPMSLIQVSNLTFGYEGSFDNVFQNASFAIDTDWKCGFIGRNGRGKTTFLNLLRGKYSYSGSIDKATRNDMAKRHHCLGTFDKLPLSEQEKDDD